jgi:hypothetical protein
MMADCVELDRFIRGELDAAAFPHREHVRMGFEMLRRYDFATSAFHYSKALKMMVAKMGKPQAFHQTVTIAFLALIAERIESGDWVDFEAFACANPDLFDPSVLQRWYSAEQLGSEAARQTFMLPALNRDSV